MTSSNRTNKVEVPEAKEALNRFKQEVASELGVPLKEGYNGDLTSRQAGSIGGEMVRKMIRSQEEKMSSSKEHLRRSGKSKSRNTRSQVSYSGFLKFP